MQTHTCTHPLSQSDHLGVTCLFCGETLAGFGFGGEGQNHCQHAFDVIEDQETCWYCAYSHPNNPQEKKVALAIIRRAKETNSEMLELIETWLVAGIRPDNIEALASAAGHTNSEHWRLAAEYFYDNE